MLNKISIGITRLLCREREKCKYEEAVYVYGIELILSTVFGLLSIIILAYLFSETVLGVIFLITLCPLRVFSGGYHAETYGKCFVISNACFLVTLLLHKFFYNKLPYICWLFIGGICLSYIVKIAPVIHVNQPLSEKKQIACKKYIKYVAGFEIIMGMMLHCHNEKALLIMEIITIMLAAVLCS